MVVSKRLIRHCPLLKTNFGLSGSDFTSCMSSKGVRFHTLSPAWSGMWTARLQSEFCSDVKSNPDSLKVSFFTNGWHPLKALICTCHMYDICPLTLSTLCHLKIIKNHHEPTPALSVLAAYAWQTLIAWPPPPSTSLFPTMPPSQPQALAFDPSSTNSPPPPILHLTRP